VYPAAAAEEDRQLFDRSRKKTFFSTFDEKKDSPSISKPNK
jgi:hypothetical protein